MPHLLPQGLALVLSTACVGFSACAAAAPAAPVRSRPEPVAPKPAPEPWPRFAESQGWPTATDDWFLSEGHYAGTSEALVHVTPDALERYRSHVRGASFEPGTVIVMLHRKRSNRTPGPVHVMVRGERDWAFLVLDPAGAIQERGELPLCQRCHAEAVSDSVFGAPLPESPGEAPE
jgi:hypothetical protein